MWLIYFDDIGILILISILLFTLFVFAFVSLSFLWHLRILITTWRTNNSNTAATSRGNVTEKQIIEILLQLLFVCY